MYIDTMSYQNQTRYTLLQRACDLDDHAAWEELFSHYRYFISYILNEMGILAGDIDDVTQQVLIHLTKGLPRYDSSRARFRTWLGAVIRNTACTHFNKQKNRNSRIKVFDEEQSLEAMINPSEIDKRIEEEWGAYIVNIAMERVRDVFQGQAVDVFVLSADGLSAAEIADKFGLSVSSVYTLRKRVKKRLYLEIRALVTELEPS